MERGDYHSFRGLSFVWFNYNYCVKLRRVAGRYVIVVDVFVQGAVDCRVRDSGGLGELAMWGVCW